MHLAPLMHQVALLFLLTMTGNEFCVAAFVEPIARRLAAETQEAIVPLIATRLGRAMPFWYAASLILSIADWWFHRGTQSAFAPGLASVLQLFIVFATLTLLVPINNRLAKMSVGYDGWLGDAVHWDRLHGIRVFLLVLASGALVRG